MDEESKYKLEKKRKQAAFWDAIIRKYCQKNSELKQKQLSLKDRVEELEKPGAYVCPRVPKTASSTQAVCSCASVAHTSAAADLDDISIFSLDTEDVDYMTKLQDLANTERQIVSQIQQLEQKENTFAKADKSEKTCSCGESYDEKQDLIDELENTKLEFKQFQEKVEGPLRRELEQEKRKSQKMQQDMFKNVKAVEESEDVYIKEIDALKTRLLSTCQNLNKLRAVNMDLQKKICCLECKYNELEKDYIQQKISEARTLEKLKECICQKEAEKRKRIALEESKKGKGDSLHQLARKLSKTIKDSDKCCKCCCSLPEGLKDTVENIKCLADFVSENSEKMKKGKKEEEEETDSESETESSGDSDSDSEGGGGGGFGGAGAGGGRGPCSCGKNVGTATSDENQKGEQCSDKTTSPEHACTCAQSTSVTVVDDEKSCGKTSFAKCSEKSVSARSSKRSSEICSSICSDGRKSSRSSKSSAKSTSKSSKDVSEIEADQIPESEGSIARTIISSETTSPRRSSKLTSRVSIVEPGEEIGVEADTEVSDAVPATKSKDICNASCATESEKECTTELQKDTSVNVYSPCTCQPASIQALEPVMVTSMTSVGDVEVDIDTEICEFGPDDEVHITTAITDSGFLEVITEGPTGIIETTMTYTDSGNIEIVTEITDYPAVAEKTASFRATTPSPAVTETVSSTAEASQVASTTSETKAASVAMQESGQAAATSEAMTASVMMQESVQTAGTTSEAMAASVTKQESDSATQASEIQSFAVSPSELASTLVPTSTVDDYSADTSAVSSFAFDSQPPPGDDGAAGDVYAAAAVAVVAADKVAEGPFAGLCPDAGGPCKGICAMESIQKTADEESNIPCAAECMVTDTDSEFDQFEDTKDVYMEDLEEPYICETVVSTELYTESPSQAHEYSEVISQTQELELSEGMSRTMDVTEVPSDMSTDVEFADAQGAADEEDELKMQIAEAICKANRQVMSALELANKSVAHALERANKSVKSALALAIEEHVCRANLFAEAISSDDEAVQITVEQKDRNLPEEEYEGAMEVEESGSIEASSKFDLTEMSCALGVAEESEFGMTNEAKATEPIMAEIEFTETASEGVVEGGFGDMVTETVCTAPCTFGSEEAPSEAPATETATWSSSMPVSSAETTLGITFLEDPPPCTGPCAVDLPPTSAAAITYVTQAAAEVATTQPTAGGDVTAPTAAPIAGPDAAPAVSPDVAPVETPAAAPAAASDAAPAATPAVPPVVESSAPWPVAELCAASPVSKVEETKPQFGDAAGETGDYAYTEKKESIASSVFVKGKESLGDITIDDITKMGPMLEKCICCKDVEKALQNLPLGGCTCVTVANVTIPPHPPGCDCLECLCSGYFGGQSGGDKQEHPPGCDCMMCLCEGNKKKSPEHLPECDCLECLCGMKNASGHGPKCSCPICNCLYGSDHPPGCNCIDCLCSSKARGSPAHAPSCNCGECKCCTCSNDKAKPEGCTCDVCDCVGVDVPPCACVDCKCDPCEHKLQHPVECDCLDCLCDPCSDPKKSHAQGDTVPEKEEHDDDCDCVECLCSPCTSKKNKEDEDEPCKVCKCTVCKCSPCIHENPADAADDSCACPTCECDPCSHPNSQPPPALPCDCEICFCDPCADPNKQQTPCNCCGTCTCEICSDPKKRTYHCDCDTCVCTPCADPLIETGECTCADCVCFPCRYPPKPMKHTPSCDCPSCVCKPCADPNIGVNHNDQCECPDCTCDPCESCEKPVDPPVDSPEEEGPEACETVEQRLMDIELESQKRKAEMEELKDLIKQIQCSCLEAEAMAVECCSPEVTKDENLCQVEETLSNLKVSLVALQKKCQNKDKMIELMKEELKVKASNSTEFNEMIMKLKEEGEPKCENQTCDHADYPNCPCKVSILHMSTNFKESVSSTVDASKCNHPEFPDCPCTSLMEAKPSGCTKSDCPKAPKPPRSEEPSCCQIEPSKSSCGKPEPAKSSCTIAKAPKSTTKCPAAVPDTRPKKRPCPHPEFPNCPCKTSGDADDNSCNLKNDDTCPCTGTDKPPKPEKCDHPDYPNCPCKDKQKPYCPCEASCMHPDYPNCICAEMTRPEPALPQITEVEFTQKCKHPDYPNCPCATEEEKLSCKHPNYPNCPCTKSELKECFCPSPKSVLNEPNCKCGIDAKESQIEEENSKCECKEQGPTVCSEPMRITDVRMVCNNTLLIKWTQPSSNLVTGYEVYIAGVLKTKVRSASRTSAILHDLKCTCRTEISVSAVTRTGRCQPPANYMFYG